MIGDASEQGHVSFLILFPVRADDESVLRGHHGTTFDYGAGGQFVTPGPIVPTVHVLRANHSEAFVALEDGDSS